MSQERKEETMGRNYLDEEECMFFSFCAVVNVAPSRSK